MIAGHNLSELVTKIQNEAKSKRDFIVDTEKIDFIVENDGFPRIEFPLSSGKEAFMMNKTFESQIATKVGIPAKYWDRMRQSAPSLLSSNVNYWFKNAPESRMVRTLGGKSRAFLSKSYRPLDNNDIAAMVLPQLDNGGWQVKSSEITEQRMYIQLVTPKIQGEVKKGDVVQSGLIISNSEVGCGSLKIEPLIYRLVCMNGMIAGHSLKKAHVGKILMDDAGISFEMFSDRTKELTDRTFWSQVNDIVGQVSSKETFDRLLLQMQESTAVKVQNPTEAVEIMTKRYTLKDQERDDILNNLIKGGDPTKWGLVNAVTASANEMDNYDRAIELERLGGHVLELPSTDVIFN